MCSHDEGRHGRFLSGPFGASMMHSTSQFFELIRVILLGWRDFSICALTNLRRVYSSVTYTHGGMVTEKVKAQAEATGKREQKKCEIDTA